MKKSLVGLLGLSLFIGGLLYTTDTFAMERHAVYFDRNYGGTSMVPAEKDMAQKEFTNTIDPYSQYQIVDASQPKTDVINALESTFGNSEEEDINYLIFHSHGWSGGIIDFSFSELRSILDQYKGHFVLVLSACNSGGMISKLNITVGEIEDSFIKAFSEPRTRSGEFKNSKYNVFCACTESQNAYNNTQYGFFIKAYFDSSKINPSDGCCNADYNKDNIVVPTELEQYLASHGNYKTKATPVAQVTDYDLPVFDTNRSNLDKQLSQTDVILKYTEPGWYGIVPANITFNDENSDEQLDATVKIVNANDQKTAYSGSKTVDVKVKSTNGFDLKDGDKEAVEYSITKKDGDAVTKNTDEQDLGTMDKATPTIASKASLKGEAKESGKFVDTLTYHFIEQ